MRIDENGDFVPTSDQDHPFETSTTPRSHIFREVILVRNAQIYLRNKAELPRIQINELVSHPDHWYQSWQGFYYLD